MGLNRYAAPAVEPVSLAEAKMHLRVTASDEDTLITALIVAAREAAENFCQRSLITQQWRKTLDAFPDAIELPMGPVQALIEVGYVDADGLDQAMSLADVQLDALSEPGWVVPAYGKSWPTTREQPNAVDVIYRTGYGDDAGAVPGPVKAWILLKVAELYEHREASAERPAQPQAFADHLLWPYRVVRT